MVHLVSLELIYFCWNQTSRVNEIFCPSSHDFLIPYKKKTNFFLPLISLKYGAEAHFLFHTNQGCLKMKKHLMWTAAFKIHDGLYTVLPRKINSFNILSLQKHSTLQWAANLVFTVCYFTKPYPKNIYKMQQTVLYLLHCRRFLYKCINVDTQEIVSLDFVGVNTWN